MGKNSKNSVTFWLIFINFVWSIRRLSSFDCAGESQGMGLISIFDFVYQFWRGNWLGRHARTYDHSKCNCVLENSRTEPPWCNKCFKCRSIIDVHCTNKTVCSIVQHTHMILMNSLFLSSFAYPWFAYNSPDPCLPSKLSWWTRNRRQTRLWIILDIYS